MRASRLDCHSKDFAFKALHRDDCARERLTDRDSRGLRKKLNNDLDAEDVLGAFEICETTRVCTAEAGSKKVLMKPRQNQYSLRIFLVASPSQ